MEPTRQYSLDDKMIWVYDNLLSRQDILRLTASLEQGAFTHNEFAREDTTAYRHWALNVPLETVVKLPIYEPAAKAIADADQGNSYRLYRCYCNYASYGDMLFTHTDCQPGEHELTALWFVAPEWEIEWGGETLFFNSSQDAEFVVSPKPGRLVIFDGAIVHVGRPPNRICFAPRFTFAMKYELVKNQDNQPSKA